MFENVPLRSIKVSSMGGFQGSKLQDFKLEYILAHIVRMSQKRGKWVTEFSFSDFLEDFNLGPLNLTHIDQFYNLFQRLERIKFLKYHTKSKTFTITNQFEKFCENYLYW